MVEQQAHRLNDDRNIRWGILGTGKIAHNLAKQLTKLNHSELVGVASRKVENAQRFCKQYETLKAYESYESLCNDPNIDVIYIATPTKLHFQHCNLVLDNNKALLCEKPFARNYEEALSIIQKAQNKQLFCMEAMWMRFNPLIQEVKKILNSNKIGKVCTLHAELGYQKALDKLGTPNDGMGASLAFGCYGISLALYLFGHPNKVSSHLTLNSKGGDEAGAVLLHYSDKVVSIFYSEGATLSNQVTIFGQDGCLTIDPPFIDATSIKVVDLNDIHARTLFKRLQSKVSSYFEKLSTVLSIQQSASEKYSHSGFRIEAEEVAQCIRLGLLESAVMPLSETLMVHKIIDETLSTLKQN